MAKIIIKAEVATTLLKNLGLFKTANNKIRFQFGLKDLGDGLASKAIIVSGGSQGELGFKVSLPEGESFAPGENGAAMLNVIVSASQFCTYLTALCGDNADVVFAEVEEKKMVLSVPGMADLPLGTFTEEEAEPLLNVGKTVVAKMQFDKNFIAAINRGSYLATNDADEQTNRSAFFVTAENVDVYSTNKKAVAKAWAKPIAFLQDEAVRAFSYLSEKMASLPAEGKALLNTKVSELQKNGDKSGLIEFAKTEGFDAASPVVFSLPAAATAIMTKLYEDNVNVVLTPRFLYVMGGSVASIYTLAGKVPGVYAMVSKWEEAPATSKVVADKERLMKTLGVVKLANMDTPVHLKYSKEEGLTFTKDGLVAYVPVANGNKEGLLSKLNDYFNVNLLTSCIGKMASGNVVIYNYGSGDMSKLVQFSSGDLSGAANSRCYVFKVAKSDAVNTDGEEPAKTDVKSKTETETKPVEVSEPAKVVEDSASTPIVKTEPAPAVEEKKPMTLEEKKAAITALQQAYIAEHSQEEFEALKEKMAAAQKGESVVFSEDEKTLIVKVKRVQAA